jgi:hypothetical protein
LYHAVGLWGKAIEESLASSEQSHLLLGALGAAYAGAGNREKALEILRRLEEQALSEYVDPLSMAAVQVGLSDPDGALASLGKARAERSPMTAFINVDPIFEPLRRYVRFQNLVGALNLS